MSQHTSRRALAWLRRCVRGGSIPACAENEIAGLGPQYGGEKKRVMASLTLMRPPVVKRQTTPMSGFFAFFRFFSGASSLGNMS